MAVCKDNLGVLLEVQENYPRGSETWQQVWEQESIYVYLHRGYILKVYSEMKCHLGTFSLFVCLFFLN